VIQRAANVISSGGVVAFPTYGLYGLGADAFNIRSIEKIFAIKRRSRQAPILVLIHSRGQLDRLVKAIPPIAAALMDRFWPGRLTLVFEAAAGLPRNLTAGSGRVGVRLAGHPVARALARALDVPLTATSANLSGYPAVSEIDHLPPEVAQGLDLILDAGPLAGGPGSTVIDVTTAPPRLIREGVVPARCLEDLLKA
jgi:L-threonylcarbamoyladenylate synthase